MRISILAALAGLVCGAASAQQAPEPRPLTAEELQGLRAGYFTVEGLKFDFSAEIRSTIDGQPVLQSKLVWSPDGAQIIGPDGSVLATGAGAASVLAPGDGGDTMVGYRLTDGALQGFVVNSASNRDIAQDLDIKVTLPGFADVQRDMVQSLTGLQIAREVSNGLIQSSSPR